MLRYLSTAELVVSLAHFHHALLYLFFGGLGLRRVLLQSLRQYLDSGHYTVHILLCNRIEVISFIKTIHFEETSELI